MVSNRTGRETSRACQMVLAAATVAENVRDIVR